MFGGSLQVADVFLSEDVVELGVHWLFVAVGLVDASKLGATHMAAIGRLSAGMVASTVMSSSSLRSKCCGTPSTLPGRTQRPLSDRLIKLQPAGNELR